MHPTFMHMQLNSILTSHIGSGWWRKVIFEQLHKPLLVIIHCIHLDGQRLKRNPWYLIGSPKVALDQFEDEELVYSRNYNKLHQIEKWWIVVLLGARFSLEEVEWVDHWRSFILRSTKWSKSSKDLINSEARSTLNFLKIWVK